MSKVYNISGKIFGFSSKEVAEQFRNEYTPFDVSYFRFYTYLSLPKYKNKIVEGEMRGQANVFDSIEECLEKFPHEAFFKFENDRLKAKSKIDLKTPLKFDNGLAGDLKMTMLVEAMDYDNLAFIVKTLEEEMKNKSNKNKTFEDNDIIGGFHLKYSSYLDPVAEITFAQYNELKNCINEVDKKIESINKASTAFRDAHKELLGEEIEEDEENESDLD